MGKTKMLLTNREIADLMGKGKKEIRKRAVREDWPTVKCLGNGGLTDIHPLHSLPVDIQECWLEKLKGSVIITEDETRKLILGKVEDAIKKLQQMKKSLGSRRGK